jgi:hypothetical protein
VVESILVIAAGDDDDAALDRGAAADVNIQHLVQLLYWQPRETK